MKSPLNEHTEIKIKLIKEAIKKYGDLYLCSGASSFFDSFTVDKIGDQKHLVFHFNYEKDGDKNWTGTAGVTL